MVLLHFVYRANWGKMKNPLKEIILVYLSKSIAFVSVLASALKSHVWK
jgi:hypothetical protein